MGLSPTQLTPIFTQKMLAKFSITKKPTNFLGNLFPSKTSPTKLISVGVEKAGETIAIDHVRGGDGTRVTFAKSTEKVFEPPYFRERMDITKLDLYDVVLGAYASGSVSPQLFGSFIDSAVEKLGMLRNRIERAKEKQCAEALLTGIITLVNGDNIDFVREAASMPVATNSSIFTTGSGYWGSSSADPFAQLSVGCEFLAAEGLIGETHFAAILGDTAYAALLQNDTFKERQNLVNMQLDAVTMPSDMRNGAVYHGTVSAGSYKVDLWTYPQRYKDPDTGVKTKYIEENKVVLIPYSPDFIYSHAMVPMTLNSAGKGPIAAEYYYGQKLDEWNVAHEYDIRSAGMPILGNVNSVWTLQALA